MCLSLICDFWLLNIILKCSQHIKLYQFVHSIFSVPFCPIYRPTILSVYHFVHTILSVPFCPIYTILSVGLYHFFHTILSVPFCPLPFSSVTTLSRPREY